MLIGYESDLTIRYAESKGYPASLFGALHNKVNSTRSETLMIAKDLEAGGYSQDSSCDEQFPFPASSTALMRAGGAMVLGRSGGSPRSNLQSGRLVEKAGGPEAVLLLRN